MTGLTLHLSAQPGAWRVFASRKQDPAFQKFSDRVFKRDSYTCQYCGFQAKDFQEVVNIDQNYYNNKISNLVTACCFCSQCFFIDAVGLGDFGGGTLIFMPELSQVELNAFCHALFCAITNETAMKASAQSIYRTIKFRSQQVEDQFGEGLSTPAIFGQMLIEQNFSDELVDEALKGVRLLPARGRFRMQLEHWAKTAMAEMTSMQRLRMNDI